MLVGRFKTYRKKESFGSLFFGLIFLPGFSSLLDPKRKGSQSDHSVTFALSDSSPGTQRRAWLGDLGTQRCRSSQSDHFVTSAPRFEFFDSQMQGTPSNFQKPGILQPPWTE